MHKCKQRTQFFIDVGFLCMEFLCDVKSKSFSDKEPQKMKGVPYRNRSALPCMILLRSWYRS